MKLLKHNNTVIHINMYLQPIFYEDSDIFSTVTYDDKTRRYNTDTNPTRIMNGPLSGPGEELEAPIKEEWLSFIDDCKYLVKETGFTIINTDVSIDSKKSQYLIIFGIDDTPRGTIVYDLRLSDHAFNATFPQEYKDKAIEYLKMNDILDGSATEKGIDFKVQKVTVGSVKNDTWNRAFNRLYDRLKQMKSKIETVH